jgi:beta-N-acetylhexosaminidase
MTSSRAPKPLPDPSELTLAQKVGQLVQIDIPDLRLGDRTRAHFARFEYNGVILFAKNISDRRQVVRLIEELHDLCAIAPMITVDQEGGLVERFRFAEMTSSPGAMALAAAGDPHWTQQAHKIMGSELASLGITLNFAPCLDVNSNPSNPIIGARSFGADVGTVRGHGVAAVLGLQAGGVGACAKHFPGHGDTDKDSHIDLPSVARSRRELEMVELAPFRAAVEVGVDAVMTAHVTFPALDPRPAMPATLSEPILTDLLRDEMGFDGVIFTDSMAMHAVAQRFGVGEAAVMSIQAGADVVLACGPFENHVASCEALLQAVESGRLSEARIDESLERIFELKARYGRLPQREPGYPLVAHHHTMTSICAKTVTVLPGAEGYTLSGRTLVLIQDVLPQTPLGEVHRAVSLAESLRELSAGDQLSIDEERYHLHASGESWREVSARAAGYDHVVVCLFSRDRLPDGQRLLVENLVRDGVRPTLVSFSSPYLFDGLPGQHRARILTYNYSPLSLQALSRVLLGQAAAPGRCPVPMGLDVLATS